MFRPITIPGQSVMMFNRLRMKKDVDIDEIEEVVGDICNIMNNTFGNNEGGFYAGQFFHSLGKIDNETGDVVDRGRRHLIITTFWKSIDHHKQSHLNKALIKEFHKLDELCDEHSEYAYENLWQGMRYNEN